MSTLSNLQESISVSTFGLSIVKFEEKGQLELVVSKRAKSIFPNPVNFTILKPKLMHVASVFFTCTLHVQMLNWTIMFQV